MKADLDVAGKMKKRMRHKSSLQTISMFDKERRCVNNASLKKLLTTIGLVCQGVYSFAQSNLKGRIKDQQQFLPYATVQLLNPDSSLVKEITTDSTGGFLFIHVLRGYYLVSSTMVGYKKYFSGQISVEAESLKLPDIVLEKINGDLQGVVVRSIKPLYEQKIDRLVINVQSSITSSGSTVLAVLQKTPGIIVNRQNNSIAMNGKAGVRVMINGKLQQVSMDIIVQMLEGMSASNIERIELITTPPAKYDAEGNAGIINIVLKQNADFGTNGSLSITTGIKWAPVFGGSFSVTHRNKNFAYFLDYSILNDHNLHEFDMDRRSTGSGFIKTVIDNSRRQNVTTQQNLNAGLEWKLNNTTFLNFGLTGYRRNWDMNAIAHDTNRTAIDTTLITEQHIHESNIWQSITGSVGVQTRINAKNKIGASVDYLYYHNSNPSFYDGTSVYQQSNLREVLKVDLKKTTPICFLIANADYQLNYSPFFTLEAGIKTAISTLENNVQVQQLKNNIWETDSFFTSYSNLREQIGAAYVSAKWQPDNKWQIISGLRYEYTCTSIGTKTQKNIINRKYGYLFPTMLLKRDINTEKDFQFSYSKRINRPTYNDIAPWVFFWGPNTFSAGNTALLPAISDAVKAGYHAKQWIISLQFTHTKNEIIFLQPEMDGASDNLVYRSQNLKYLNTIGTTTSYSFKISSWWTMQSGLTAQYQVAQTLHLANNIRKHSCAANINVVNLVKLPNDFSIEVSGMYQSKVLTGISEYLPVWLLNAGIQKKMGEKGTIKLAMDDILYSNYWKIRTYVPLNNLDTHFTYDFHNQFIRLTYSRNFGNHKLNSVKLKSGSDEERKRVAN